MCAIASSTPSTTRTAMMASRYSVDQSASVAGLTRRSASRAASSPRTSQPAAMSSLISVPRCSGGQAWSISSVSAAPQTPVRRILALGMILIAVDVTIALQMADHRYAGLGLDTRNQALATARHQHIDELLHSREHLADGGAI